MLNSRSAFLTQRMLDLAEVEPGSRVLDLACGAGEPALSAALRAGKEGRVLGVDIAEGMVEFAREKAAAADLSNVEFRRIDSELVDVEPESFDAVTCRWGIMFMPEPAECMGRANAALRPGGRTVLATWARPSPLFELAIDVLGDLVDVPPPPPDARGIFDYGDEGALERLLLDAGFADARVERVEVPFLVTDRGRDYWDFVSTVSGPIPALVRQQPPVVQEALAEAVSEAAEAHAVDGTITLGGITMLASATKAEGP